MNISESARASPEEKLLAAENAVRREPALANHRWILFRWLRVDCQWTRAMRQLQAWAKLAPDQVPVAQARRDLIRAERWREKTLSGLTPRGDVVDTSPPWMAGLYMALEQAARGDNTGLRRKADPAVIEG
jgi:type VI secretion system protein ImpE